MKQVDADGLELITVNGGELKPTQGGGETPSMATDCDAASPTQGAADLKTGFRKNLGCRVQKKGQPLLLFCTGVSRLPPVSFYRGVMRTKVHCLLTTGFSVLPLRVSGPSDVETARARAQPLLSRPRRPLSEDLNICSILRDATRTPQTPNPPIIPK